MTFKADFRANYMALGSISYRVITNNLSDLIDDMSCAGNDNKVYNAVKC